MEPATLDPRVVSSSPTVGEDATYKNKILGEKKKERNNGLNELSLNMLSSFPKVTMNILHVSPQ